MQEVGHPGHLVGLDCLAYQFGVVAGHDHQLVGFRRLVQEQAVVGQRAALYDLLDLLLEAAQGLRAARLLQQQRQADFPPCLIATVLAGQLVKRGPLNGMDAPTLAAS